MRYYKNKYILKLKLLRRYIFYNKKCYGINMYKYNFSVCRYMLAVIEMFEKYDFLKNI